MHFFIFIVLALVFINAISTEPKPYVHRPIWNAVFNIGCVLALITLLFPWLTAIIVVLVMSGFK